MLLGLVFGLVFAPLCCMGLYVYTWPKAGALWLCWCQTLLHFWDLLLILALLVQETSPVLLFQWHKLILWQLQLALLVSTQ